MLCQECSKKPTCTKLCKEAEEYVNQDHVDWMDLNESIYTHGEELRVYDPNTGVDKPLLSPREKEILYALASGLTRQEIAEKLKISRANVRVHIGNMRKKALRL